MDINWIFTLITAAFGLAVGSFLGGIQFRVVERKRLGPRSVCPSCGHALAFLDLIPVVSFVMLRGCCRYCHAPISRWYPAVEIGTAVLFLIVASQSTPYASWYDLLLFFRDLFAVAIFFLLAVVDLRYGVLPDAITLPALAILGIAQIVLLGFWSIPGILLGMLLGGGLFFAQYVLTRGKAVGDGDIRFGILLGAALGFQKTALALIIAYAVGAIVAVVLVGLQKKTLKSHIALGPFLSLGGAVALLWGDVIIRQLLITNY